MLFTNLPTWLWTFYRNQFKTWDTFKYEKERVLPRTLVPKVNQWQNLFVPGIFFWILSRILSLWMYWNVVSLLVPGSFYCFYLGANLCLPRFWHFYPRINYPRWSALLCFPSKQSGQEIRVSWANRPSVLVWDFAFQKLASFMSTSSIYNWLKIFFIWI